MKKFCHSTLLNSVVVTWLVQRVPKNLYLDTTNAVKLPLIMPSNYQGRDFSEIDLFSNPWLQSLTSNIQILYEIWLEVGIRGGGKVTWPKAWVGGRGQVRDGGCTSDSD